MTTKPAGRKPASDKKRKEKTLLLYMTPQEYEEISAAADADSRSFSRYVVVAALEKARGR